MWGVTHQAFGPRASGLRKKGVPSLFQLKMGGGFFPSLSKAYTQDKQSESIFFFLGEGNWFPAEIVRKIEARKKREGQNEKEGRERERDKHEFFFFLHMGVSGKVTYGSFGQR